MIIVHLNKKLAQIFESAKPNLKFNSFEFEFRKNLLFITYGFFLKKLNIVELKNRT